MGELIGKDQGFVWHLLNRTSSIKAKVAIDIANVSGVSLEKIVSDFHEHECSESANESGSVDGEAA